MLLSPRLFLPLFLKKPPTSQVDQVVGLEVTPLTCVKQKAEACFPWSRGASDSVARNPRWLVGKEPCKPRQDKSPAPWKVGEIFGPGLRPPP